MREHLLRLVLLSPAREHWGTRAVVRGLGCQNYSLYLPWRRLQEELERENDKRQQWKDENIRRRHNYIPFMFEMLRALGEKGQLQPLIDKARQPQ